MWCFIGNSWPMKVVQFKSWAMKHLQLFFKPKFNGYSWGHEKLFCKMHWPWNDVHGILKWFSWDFHKSQFHSVLNVLIYKTHGNGFIACCWVMDALRRLRIAKLKTTRGIMNSLLTSSACSIGIRSTLALFNLTKRNF